MSAEDCGGMRRSAAACLALAAVMLLTAGAAQAANQTVEKRWQAMDRCTAEATAAHPESTPQSLAQRDTAMRNCQRQNHVPIRSRLVPKMPSQPPAPGSPQH